MEMMNELMENFSGIYLVIDPSMEEIHLLDTLGKVVPKKPCAIQIWDNFKSSGHAHTLIPKIQKICEGKVPVLLNNHADWVEHYELDGIHYDEVSPKKLAEIQKLQSIGKIVGATINNDLTEIKRLIHLKMDYLSFCSIFPSSTANSCELVDFETIKKVREITAIPIFLSGGITTKNISQLQSLDFDGIAVVSGIMSAEDPEKAIFHYQELLKELLK